MEENRIMATVPLVKTPVVVPGGYRFIFTWCILALLILTGTELQAQQYRSNNHRYDLKKLTELFYARVYNQHDVDAVDSLLAPGYVEHQTTHGYASNRAGLKRALQHFFKAFPDFKVTVNFMIVKNDMVVSQITITGTNTDSFDHMPATNKKINVSGVDIVRYKNGKAVEHWGYLEEGKLLTQLGVFKK